MATIIYDPKQDRSVNLDNVDTILTADDNDGDFKIYFEKLIVVRERYFHVVLETWKYNDATERDSVHASIIKEHGTRMGYNDSFVEV